MCMALNMRVMATESSSGSATSTPDVVARVFPSCAAGISVVFLGMEAQGGPHLELRAEHGLEDRRCGGDKDRQYSDAHTGRIVSGREHLGDFGGTYEWPSSAVQMKTTSPPGSMSMISGSAMVSDVR